MNNVIFARPRVVLSLALLCAGSSQAAVTWDFNFTDDPGIGFNAAGSVGEGRRAVLAQAGDYISGILGPSYTANINMDVNGGATGDTLLASAGSNFNSSYPGEGFGSKGDVMLKILGGNSADPNTSLADGTVNWNFTFEWETGTDFQPGEQDMLSTAIHELTHALGFASDINQDGSSSWGDAAGTPTAWSPFDEFVADSNGALIGPTIALDGARWNTASLGGTGANGLFFIGANAMAANGGNPVNIFSPGEWQGGSSGSHLDTDFFTGSDVKMMNHEASVAEGLDIREYSPLEVAMLRDLGYTNAAIPEPTTFVFGLSGILIALSRRRRSV